MLSWLDTDLVFNHISASENQVIATCFNDPEILQHILLRDAFLSIQHVINSRSVTAGLCKQTIHAYNTQQ